MSEELIALSMSSDVREFSEAPVISALKVHDAVFDKIINAVFQQVRRNPHPLERE